MGALSARALWTLVLAAAACAPPPPSSRGAPSTPLRVVQPAQTGHASWYGQAHHGRRTASGEIFDMHALTAAHRTLPLGTRVRVINLVNHRTVEVRVNDRGPFRPGRLIDLSYGAARVLHAVDAGIIPVRVVILSDR